MAILTSIWVNLIFIIVLCVSAYLLISKINLANSIKIIVSIFAVIFIFSLLFASGYSSYYLKNKKDSYKILTPRIVEIKNLSDLESDKYLVNIVVPPGLTKKQIIQIAIETNDFILKKEKKLMILWLTFFDKKLPNAEYESNADNPHYVCQTQWINENYSGLVSKNFDVSEKYKNLEILWKK